MASDTAFQLDMTSFYSAELAMKLLNAGRPDYASDLQPDLAQLSAIVVASLLFDTIYVALPSVIDEGRIQTGFNDEASALLLALAKEPAIVKVLSIDESKKQEARIDLEDTKSFFEMTAVQFFTDIKGRDLNLLAGWAHNQVSNSHILNHTRLEEKNSSFHTEWTKSITQDVLQELDKKNGIAINMCHDDVKEHIVRTSLRGHMYRACGLRETYLPHYIREGLLSFSSSPTSMERAIHQAAGRKMYSEAAPILETEPSMRVVPFLTKSIFQSFGNDKRWEPNILADDLRAERATEQNKTLRQYLREAKSDIKRSEIITEWVEQLNQDMKVSRREVLPAWLELIPNGLATVKIIDATQGEAFLLRIFKLLPKKLAVTFNNPIYLSTHMRYLWSCANGRCTYLHRNQVAPASEQKLLE